MPKNIFHDIVPPEKRSIRNIKIHSVRKDKPILSDDIRREEFVSRQSSGEIESQKAPKKGVWFLALCCFVGLVFSILFLVSTAEVSITVKKFDVELSDAISASKSGEGLLYSSITLSDKDIVEITGAEQKEVSTKASGTVVVYNSQSVAQILIAGTRLETDEGLIFLIDKRIVVPAQKTVSGTKLPGNIEVSIKAEKPGSKYNVGLADFTVPAFKGGAKYNLVYAKSKNEVAGGNLGMVPVVADKDIVEAQKKLEEALIEKIVTSARAQIPETSVLLNGLYSVEFTNIPQEVKEDKLVVGMNATLVGYIFEKNNLAEFISKTKKTEVPIDNSISISSPDMSVSSLSEEKEILKFNAKGTVKITYVPDIDKLKSEMKGKSKSGVTDLLKSLTFVEAASIKTYPLWMIPRNTDRIKINLN